MKNSIILSFIFSLLFISCSKDLHEDIDLKSISTYESRSLNPKVNETCLVLSSNGDTLAISGVQMGIHIAKGENVAISYVIDSKYEEYKNKGVFDEYATVCFEDDIIGDCDYNDLVFKVHSRLIYASNKYKVQFIISPLAMGNSIPLKLGFETYSGEEYILANDCRDDMFNGEKDFINTELDKPKLTFKDIHTRVYDLGTQDSWNNTRINWFIETNGKKLYVAAYDHNREYFDYVNSKGKPFGLVIPDVWEFYYPIEKVNINKAYPLFDDWLKGKVSTFKQGNTQSQFLYK